MGNALANYRKLQLRKNYPIFRYPDKIHVTAIDAWAVAVKIAVFSDFRTLSLESL